MNPIAIFFLTLTALLFLASIIGPRLEDRFMNKKNSDKADSEK